MSEQQPATDEAGLRALITTMADRLRNEDPDEPMTEAARLGLARELASRDTDLRTALLASSIHVAPKASRHQYAGVLLAVADTLDLVSRHTAAVRACRAIAERVGIRDCDDSPEWRAAEAEATALWAKAREAGHTVATLMAASKAEASS